MRPVALSPEERTIGALNEINRTRERKGLSPLERSDVLDQAAMALLPEDDAGLGLSASGDLFGLLPAGQRGYWRALSAVVGACGGCGIQPTDADVRSFTEQWLSNPQNAEALLEDRMTHFGFAMRANGEGKKVAIAVLGQRS